MKCYRCQIEMEEGTTTALGLLGGGGGEGQSDLVFVITKEQTSMNPIKAFQQGLHQSDANAAFRIEGRRCPTCGLLELYAVERCPLP